MPSAQWTLSHDLLPEIHAAAKLGNMVTVNWRTEDYGDDCGVDLIRQAEGLHAGSRRLNKHSVIEEFQYNQKVLLDAGLLVVCRDAPSLLSGRTCCGCRCGCCTTS